MATVQHSRLLQTYFYEVNTRGKRGAAARTAAVHRVSRQWVERLAKRHAKEAERIPVASVAPVLPVSQLQPPVAYDPLLIALVLAPIRHNTHKRRRTVDMRIGVYMVLCATMITVCCCVVLPPAALVVVPSWGLLIRELNTALNWEKMR